MSVSLTFLENIIDNQAHEAATSPHNDVSEPTEKQIKAGNYKKGHLSFQGLSIAIENPSGSFRRGVDPDGKPWKSKLYYHYGYIKNTNASDGDPVDIFIGPNHNSEKVFVINQKNKEGKFDEVKVMLGFDDLISAFKGYLKNYEKGWIDKNMVGSVEESTLDDFKNWIKNGNLKKPYKGI